jgi:hypothetical protein
MCYIFFLVVAEGVGFEPTKGFTPYLVSSEALSTTQPTLQFSLCTYASYQIEPENQFCGTIRLYATSGY